MPNIPVTDAGKVVADADLPQRAQEYTMQNISNTNSVYCAVGSGKTATAQQNLRLAPGESVCSRELPAKWRLKAHEGLHFITDAGLEANVILDW